MGLISNVTTSEKSALWKIQDGTDPLFSRYVASTPESRAICNDPFVLGYQYTSLLEDACARVLTFLGKELPFAMNEDDTVVLNILRGGLNFGLRGALAKAFSWNRHASAFISAQRARSARTPEEWYITENAYQKVVLPNRVNLVFGDVVATGTSLEYALQEVLRLVDGGRKEVSSIVFFTIGGQRSEEILAKMCETCAQRFAGFRGAAVIYLEGRFAVAAPDTPVSVKFTGTDLLRRDSLLPPEFVESQYDHPAYPLERCTIYDAGSRAFWIPEYLEDIEDYWTKTKALADDGMTFQELLEERMPTLELARFGRVDLKTIANEQLQRCHALASGRVS